MSETDSPQEAADAAEASDSPVTCWLRELEAGDQAAAQPLYAHFCARVHEVARSRMPANVRSVYDEDDVAVSAFHSLFFGIQEQRFRLRDRSDFWLLLLTIAERKISRRIRHETRDKRDVRRLVQQSLFRHAAAGLPGDRNPAVELLPALEPTPEFAAEVADTCDVLLASLPDDNSRQIALLKLENLTAEEIAARLNCSRRTVQRRLLVIRRLWQDGDLEAEAADASPSAIEGPI